MSQDKVREQAVWAGAVLAFGVLMLLVPGWSQHGAFDAIVNVMTAVGTVGVLIFAVYTNQKQADEKTADKQEVAYLHAIAVKDSLQSAIIAIADAHKEASLHFPKWSFVYHGAMHPTEDQYLHSLSSRRLDILYRRIQGLPLLQLGPKDLERLIGLPNQGAYQIHQGIVYINSAIQEIKKPTVYANYGRHLLLDRILENVHLSLVHLEAGQKSIIELRKMLRARSR